MCPAGTLRFARSLLISFAALPWLAAVAPAESIYETLGPFGGPFGLWGYDVFVDQSVAVRFTPAADYTLNRVSLWFMSNDFSGGTHALVKVSLCNDKQSGTGDSIPGATVYENWLFNVSAVGWDPQLEVLDSALHPLLTAGKDYWVVCRSDSPPFVDGVWNIASFGTGFVTNTDAQTGEWYPGRQGAVVCTIVEGTRLCEPCDANCDGSVNLFDIEPFVGVLSGATPCSACAGDTNGDGTTNLFDIQGFVDCLGG